MPKENVYCNQENILNEISLEDSSVRLSQAFDTGYIKGFLHSNQNYARAYKHQFKIGLAKSTIQDTKRYLKVIIFFGRRGELCTTFGVE